MRYTLEPEFSYQTALGLILTPPFSKWYVLNPFYSLIFSVLFKITIISNPLCFYKDENFKQRT